MIKLGWPIHSTKSRALAIQNKPNLAIQNKPNPNSKNYSKAILLQKMQSSFLMLLPFLFLAFGMANAGLTPPVNQLLTKNSSPNMLELVGNNKLASATCYDPKMASIINSAVKAYSHNMGQLSNYILNQIKIARFSGYWFVHSEMIGRQTAQVEWNSVATGDIFSPASRHGCYYHDGQTYIVVLQY